jgi:Zn-dependent peptidase ImmA (M78 family)/DNA-binding XRE family transcriptional regulator
MNRIKQLRLARGLSLDALADSMGGIVTKQALSKYELGISRPGPSVTTQLARALGIKAMELWTKPSVTVRFLGYRKRQTLPKKWQETFEASLSRKLEERLTLQEYCYKDVAFDLPVNAYAVKNESDAEGAAERLREKWKLGLDPISDLTAVLEDHLVHVIECDAPEKFDGISATIEDDTEKVRAAAVVCRANCAGERQRLSLAHELGHVVMKPLGGVDEEKAAFRFAGAFLAPRPCLEREIGSKRTRIRFEELLILKRRFGMSIQALLRRLLDIEVINESHYKWWFIYLTKMKWRKAEPEPLPAEIPSWFRQAVLRSVAEGFLSTDEGGKMLGENLDIESGPGMLRRRSFLKLPLEERRKILEAQAEKLQKHYEKDEDGWEGTQTDDLHEYE